VSMCRSVCRAVGRGFRGQNSSVEWRSLSARNSRWFAETLIAALKGTKWPIIVYSAYEKTTLTELARVFPDLARPIAGIVKRLSDLLPVVRDRLYHPGFEFSNSIKSVAPALCPDVTYDDLDEIADRASASTAFWQMASGLVDE
jgi:hypothetical protein